MDAARSQIVGGGHLDQGRGKAAEALRPGEQVEPPAGHRERISKRRQPVPVADKISTLSERKQTLHGHEPRQGCGHGLEQP